MVCMSGMYCIAYMVYGINDVHGMFGVHGMHMMQGTYGMHGVHGEVCMIRSECMGDVRNVMHVWYVGHV